MRPTYRPIRIFWKNTPTISFRNVRGPFTEAGRSIEKVLKLKVVELDIDPQLMGALGAAEYARQKGLARS